MPLVTSEGTGHGGANQEQHRKSVRVMPRNRQPLSEQTARINRERLASEGNARARDEIAQEAIAIRKNMSRLRDLRLAREAEDQRRSKDEIKPKKRFSDLSEVGA